MSKNALISSKKIVIPRLIISDFERSISKKIEYKDSNITGIFTVVFYEFIIKENNDKFFSAEKITCHIDPSSVFADNKKIKLNIKNASIKENKVLTSVFSFLSIDPKDGAMFGDVDCFLEKDGENIRVPSFKAVNRYMTITSSGAKFANGDIDFDLSVALSLGSVDIIPESVREPLLGKIREDSAKSDFKIAGNLRRSDISVKANFFNESLIKLDIKPVVK